MAITFVTQSSVMSETVCFLVLDLKDSSELHCKIIYSIVSVSSCLVLCHRGFMSKE